MENIIYNIFKCNCVQFNSNGILERWKLSLKLSGKELITTNADGLQVIFKFSSQSDLLLVIQLLDSAFI